MSSFTTQTFQNQYLSLIWNVSSPFIILQVISFAFLAEDYKLIFVGVESKVIKVGLAVKKEEIFITYLTRVSKR